ncbi:MAG: hypothetical protein FJ405_17385 [Verrucomicrobia bacterium]|nr:hypothetical protein [Verrucomicrobiota bacterium]
MKRTPHATDGRARCVDLLPAGHRKYEEARDLAIQLQLKVLEVLPAAKRESFLAQLDAVAQACRDEADEVR